MLKPKSHPQSRPATGEVFHDELRVIRNADGRYGFANVGVRKNGDIVDVSEQGGTLTGSADSPPDLYEMAIEHVRSAFDKQVIDVERA